jgi:hypothetical protein
MKNLFGALLLLSTFTLMAGPYPLKGTALFGPDERIRAYPQGVFSRLLMIGPCTGALVWSNLALTTFECLKKAGVIIHKIGGGEHDYVTSPLPLSVRYRAMTGAAKLPVAKILEAYWPSQLPTNFEQEIYKEFSPLVKSVAKLYEADQRNWAIVRLSSNLGTQRGYFELADSFGETDQALSEIRFAYYRQGEEKDANELITLYSPCTIPFFSPLDTFQHACDAEVGHSEGAPFWKKTAENKIVLVGMHTRSTSSPLLQEGSKYPITARDEVLLDFRRRGVPYGLAPSAENPETAYFSHGVSVSQFGKKILELRKLYPLGALKLESSGDPLKFKPFKPFEPLDLKKLFPKSN